MTRIQLCIMSIFALLLAMAGAISVPTAFADQRGTRQVQPSQTAALSSDDVALLRALSKRLSTATRERTVEAWAQRIQRAAPSLHYEECLALAEYTLAFEQGGGSMDDMNLQSKMDRRSKLAEMISNILKKQHDTMKSIAQNLK